MLEYLESQGTAGPAIFAVAGFLATAFLIGWGLIGRELSRKPHETFFLSLTLGIDIVIVLATPFQWLGMLPDLAVRLIFAGGLAGVGVLAVLHRQTLAKRWAGFPWHLLPFVLLGLLTWKNALRFPWSYDDLTYQIAVPDRWLKANSLEVFFDNPFSAFAGVNLIGNLVLLKAGGLLGPLLFNYALGLILAVGVHFLVRQQTGPWTATIFSLSFVLSVSFLMVAISAYAELWILLQLMALLFLVQRSGWRDILLMGFFAGIAAAVKLTGVIIPVAMSVYLFGKLASRERKRPEHPSAKTLVAHAPSAPWFVVLSFLGPLLLMLLFFYSRPFLATGNPVYPYFAHYFTSDEATLAMSTYHHNAGKLRYGPPMKGPWQTAWFYCATPILLCLDPIRNTRADYDGCFGLQGLVHFLLVASLALEAWRRHLSTKKPHALGGRPLLYLGAAVMLYTFWFCTAQQARFLLPGYLCLILAGSFARNLLSGPGTKGLLVVMAGLTLLSLWPGDIVKQIAYSWYASPINLVYSATNDEYLKACSMLLNTPKDARILLLYEQRGLYVPRSYVIGTPFFQERFFTPPDNIDSEFLDVLKRNQITHILVGLAVNDPDRMPNYMIRAEPVRQCLLRLKSHGLRQMDIVWSIDGIREAYVLYAVDLPRTTR